MKIIVDAMGGDNAPQEIVAGALAAVKARPELEMIRMPRMRLTMRVAALKSAPVLPAETKASPWPSRSMVRPTVMEESGLFRNALAGSSCMSMTSVAFTTLTRLGRAPPAAARTSASRPTRIISSSGRALTAARAPATISCGAFTKKK